MKTNKKHIIIPALMMAVGVGLVGSISGTVAWYQYSTRVQASYIGTSVKCSENMEIRVSNAAGSAHGEWGHELVSTDVTAQLGSFGSAVSPVTSGAMTATAALAGLKGHPIYQVNDDSEWGAAAVESYVQFKLDFRVLDVDGASTKTYLAKKVYMTDLTIADVSTGVDLSNAVRVHVSDGTSHNLLSKAGGNTDTNGALDLNNDGAYDLSEGYEWDTRTELTYGAGQQASTAAASFVSTVGTGAAITSNTGYVCTTAASADGSSITVTIWLEGWQKLATGETDNKETSNSAVWSSSTYIGKQFRVGMRFAVQPIGVADI